MKKIFSFLVAVLTVATVCAQSQIATLSHEGEISTFYGVNALSEANNKAVDGDVITLSAGSFNAVDFSKLITVRGAGMGVKLEETDENVEQTTIVGDFKVSAAGDNTNHLILEGIACDNKMTLNGVQKAQFIKCKIYDCYTGGAADCTFLHCYISNETGLYQGSGNQTITGISSYFNNINLFSSTSGTDVYSYTFNNCILASSYTSDVKTFEKASCNNCIFINTNTRSSSAYLTSNTKSVYYSLWYGASNGTPFKNTPSGHYNNVFPTDGQLFEDSTFYKLTEAGKEYKGSDGTELGIYGGSMPFDPTPSNLQIKKFEVASKTTSDGKLSVDIEVE